MKVFKTKFVVAGAIIGIALSFCFSAPVRAQEDDKVVFKVNEREIRASELALAGEELLPYLRRLPAKDRYPYIISFLIERNLMAQAAIRAKVGKSDAYNKIMRYYQVMALQSVYLNQHIRPLVSKQLVRETYEKEKKSAKPRQRAKASHIVVKTKKEADDIFAKVSGGEDFAQLAKTRSIDETAAQGGDLGYFFAEEMVKEFSDVVFKLKPGQIGGPVNTKWGWHVIKLVEMRTVGPKRFEDVERGITAILVQQKRRQEIVKMKKIYKIEYLDPDLIKLHKIAQERKKQKEKKSP